MKVLVFGATSVIAQECVKIWAKQGADLILSGRSAARINEVASDLRVRFPHSNIEELEIDLENLYQLQMAVEEISDLDICLIAQGSLTDQRLASANLEYLRSELGVNAVSVAVLSELIASKLQAQNNGVLGIIGSVAGDRGRAYNYSYGASKALLETFTQGLQQRLANSNAKVILIKPGPTDTPMTTNHSGIFSSPEEVASVIVRKMRTNARVIYAPTVWKYVMLIVRTIPFFIFRKMNF